MGKLLTNEEAAARADLSIKHLDYLRRHGHIKSVKLTAFTVRIDRDSLDEYLKAHPKRRAPDTKEN